ncbi:MAG: aminoacyl-tRNA hydrolase [bacterium]
MILFVGLGNPEPSYKDTRHNLGFKAIDLLSTKTKIGLKKEDNCLIGFGKIEGIDVALAKPLCFMNESGGPIFSIYKKLNPDAMIVIHDDMDITPGRIKIKKGGQSAGHRGILSIIHSFGRDDFLRIRIGIGKPTGNGRDYVLSPPHKEEEKMLEDACNMAADACFMIAKNGIKKAMDKYNAKCKSQNAK